MSWPTVRLGDLVDMNPKHDETVDRDAEVSFVPMAVLDARTGRTASTESRRFGDVQSGYRPLRDRDLVVAKITPCFENGKIGQVAIPHRAGVGSTEFHVLRPCAHASDRYLFHFLRQERIRVDGARQMTGSAGQRRVPARYLADLNVPLPILAEQRRIAEILDRADALRAKRREAIAHLDDLTQSVFLDMFGTTNSDTMLLGEITNEFRYGTSNKAEAGGHPTLRIPNVVDGRINLDEIKYVPVTEREFERLRLQRGDLLFVRSNGNPNNVGRCSVFDLVDTTPFIYASYLIRLRPNREHAHPVYLREFLNTPVGRRALRTKSKTSAGQYNINIKGLESIAIPTPPLELQKTFADRVAHIESLKATHGAHLAELDSLFESLQQRAFAGEL